MSKTYKNTQFRFDDDDYNDQSRQKNKKNDSWKIERRKANRRDNTISDKLYDEDANENHI